MHKLTTEWNASADIFNWNNLECKCKHFQMQKRAKHSRNQMQENAKKTIQDISHLCLSLHVFWTRDFNFTLKASKSKFKKPICPKSSKSFCTMDLRVLRSEGFGVCFIWKKMN